MGTFAPFTNADTPAMQAFNTLLEQYNVLGQPNFMQSALSTLLDSIAADQISGILPAFVDAAKAAGLPHGVYVFTFTESEQAFRPAKVKAAKSTSTDPAATRGGKTIIQVKLADGQTFEKLTSAAEALGLTEDKRTGINSQTLWKNLREAGLTEKIDSVMFGDHIPAETRLLFKK